MYVVSSRDLRPKLGDYLERAKAGDEVVVLVHGRPAARLRALRSDDACPLVSSRFVRDELHTAIEKARANCLSVTWHGHMFAVLEAAPKGLNLEFWEEDVS